MADQTRPGSLLRRGRGTTEELSRRILHEQRQLHQVRVQGQVLPRGRQGMCPVPQRELLSGRGDQAVPCAHVPGRAGPDIVQAVLIGRDSSGDIQYVSRQAPAGVVRGGHGGARVCAVFALSPEIRPAG